MLLTTEIILKWTVRIKMYYISKGYFFTNIGDEFTVKIEDVPLGSDIIVEFSCDYCNNSSKVKYSRYNRHRLKLTKDCCGNYECRKSKVIDSNLKIYGVEQTICLPNRGVEIAKTRQKNFGTYTEREGFKICSKCRVEKALEEFNVTNKNLDGKASHCKDCLSQKAKEYNQKYKTEIRKRVKLYEQKNAEKIRNKKRIRKETRAGVDADLTEDRWVECKKQFNYTCAYCGVTEEEHKARFNQTLHQDHFIAYSKGGIFSVDNIIPACISCNSGKSNNDPYRWYPKQKFYKKERMDKIECYFSQLNPNHQLNK